MLKADAAYGTITYLIKVRSTAKKDRSVIGLALGISSNIRHKKNLLILTLEQLF